MPRLINRELVQFLRVVVWRKWGLTENGDDDIWEYVIDEQTSLRKITYVGECMPIPWRGMFNRFYFEYAFIESMENFVYMTLEIRTGDSSSKTWGHVAVRPMSPTRRDILWAAGYRRSNKVKINFAEFRDQIDRLIAMPEFNPTKEHEHA